VKKNLIRFDWAIKRLLRNKANFVILEGFLSELLGEDIKIDDILESESNKQSADNRMNRVDLLVKNTKGELVIIEVQSSYSHDYLMRILFGVSKLIVDNMYAGMEYRNIKKVISVNIVYFDLGHGVDYIYHGTTKYTGIHKNDLLHLSMQEQIIFNAEHIEQIYPEFYIIKVNNFDNIAKNTLDEWIYFLKNEEINDNTEAKGLKAAKKGLDLLKLSKEDMLEYERDEAAWRDYASVMSTNFIAGRLEGKKEGKMEGKVEGKMEEKIEMAKNCLIDGMSITKIAKLTGLTEEEISNIAL
jgi:predicted transposase/invertase (TIGR01784 family)